MIRTVVIDDEESNVELISNLIQLYAPNLQLAGVAHSVASGCHVILQQRPELVFLDVQMGDGTGFDLLKQLGNINFKVIFITAHQEFAIEAFHFSAQDYLLKPVSPSQLMSAIQKAAQAISNDELRLKLDTLLSNFEESSVRKKKIVLKTLERVYAVSSNEIIRFEADGSYTTAYLQDGKKIVVSRLLKDFEDLLGGCEFFRVHQSHLVNLDFLFCFEKGDSVIVLKDQSVIPVSARKKELLLKFIQPG